MANFNTDQYYQAYEAAPAALKDALFSDATSNSLNNIYARHNISDGKALNISADIGYILIGLIPIKKFIAALQEDAGLDEATAKNVAHDIRAQIFAPVAKELAALQQQAEQRYAQMAQKPAQPPASPQPPTPSPQTSAPQQEPNNNSHQESVAREKPPQGPRRSVPTEGTVDLRQQNSKFQNPNDKSNPNN